MLTATFPPFPLHSEPAHSCAGCQQLGKAARPGEIIARPFCRLHITPFSRCAHFDTGRPATLYIREGGA